VDLRIFVEPQQGASYDQLLRIAQTAERLGFDAFFRSDHYLAMGEGDGLPGPSDAWITLAGIARDTSRIRLGTLVTPATFRLPGPLAISVANVDLMSGGRVELGLGAGWFEREHAAYAIPFPDTPERFARFEEQAQIVHGLWTTPLGQPFSFDGRYYTLREAPALPKPAQSPPPLVLGGSGRKRSAALAARLAAEYNVGFSDVDETGQVIARVRAAAASTGRELVYSAAIETCVAEDEAELARRAKAFDKSGDELRATALGGTPEQVVRQLGRYADVGVTRCYMQIMDLDDLEHLELIASQVLPRVR
jgi:F420-dependent oxidoreductase-like protein